MEKVVESRSSPWRSCSLAAGECGRSEIRKRSTESVLSFFCSLHSAVPFLGSCGWQWTAGGRMGSATYQSASNFLRGFVNIDSIDCPVR